MDSEQKATSSKRSRFLSALGLKSSSKTKSIDEPQALNAKSPAQSAPTESVATSEPKPKPRNRGIAKLQHDPEILASTGRLVNQNRHVPMAVDPKQERMKSQVMAALSTPEGKALAKTLMTE